MPVVDTDFLFALSPGDPKHGRVLKHLKKPAGLIAPDTAVLEFQIVLRNRKREVGKVKMAMLALHEVLSRHRVREASTLTSDLLVLQCELEEKYGLSYFDSLVAASALALDREIISDDKAFDRVPDLKRISLSRD
ncbi:MAG: PIN domain-containing protein [Candidatus Hadarchaeota archaeon]|nr:PIN domain-containing protein [Candidatus Hadarchaeota archaeon]